MGSPRPGKWGPPRGRGGVGVWCRGRGPGARAGEGGLAVEGEWLTQRGGWHAALPLQASVADHRTRVTEGSGAGWGRVGARGPTGRLRGRDKQENWCPGVEISLVCRPHSRPQGGGGVTRAPCWVGVGRLQTPGASRACSPRKRPPKPTLLTAPRVFLSAPTATEFGESVRTLWPPAPWLAQPCSWSPPPRHLSDSRLGARPARKGLGEGAPLVSTCDGELNFSFTRCRGNAGGGDEWAGRGALRVNQLRRRPRGVPALARRCLGNAQRTGAQLPRLRKGAAPEWMNCPTLSRVYSGLPPHSPAYLDLTPHP